MGAWRPLNAWVQPFRHCPAVIFDESACARPNERAGDGGKRDRANLGVLRLDTRACSFCRLFRCKQQRRGALMMRDEPRRESIT